MDRTITRRNGKSVRIPVDDDGYVPVKALIERQEMRRPHAQLMDSFQTAKVVRPMKMTPEQAAPWFISPGRSDIQGIDAPADAIVTMRSDADGHLKCGSRRQKAVKTNGNGSRNEEDPERVHRAGPRGFDATNGGRVMDTPYSLNRSKGSYNPKRDMLPAFASAETGAEYPLSNSGFKHYLDDYAELHYIEGSRSAVMRELKSRLQPVPGLAIDIDVGDVQDSLEVLR